MAAVWDADIDITPELASRLIAEQFPALAPVRLQPFGTGWDNVAYLVNDGLVFRFPRRAVAVPLLEREARLLPRLAPRLPLPIPAPRDVGVPTEAFPYLFAGYPRIAGTPAADLLWTDDARTANAVPLAHFLAALHSVPVDDAARAGAPGDEIARADLAKRVPMVIERLSAIAPLLPDHDTDALIALVKRLAADTPPWGGKERRWVHGDLYARHLLVNGDRRLCGVIDWGDLHLGDRAVDLGIAFSFLPPNARAAFRAAYDAGADVPIDEATWDRARFRALHYGAVLVLYGAEVGDAAIRAAGEYALTVA
jgi:aminoglycoside phosphotransferase (APT) family kinase protein